ncbi:uncharacterized protein A1O9_03556 [Exophiala aquamarina CBS 119918]|uniref:3-oxo-5-alpha-steroid 4-dehydrogenase C-terminal domain-containing protein n=1 Tax=Exophiala aquamarina CBS 119918 TaxID=1182545 RepID=A0A072PPE8_9EURO|nr:uncharacterized protein A1O9_03556 [Exophiala aquamarina CBS 119918]KEF61984.1 hypothetical protein A1O9_03556 [Exophiala aquamarina CBS 119918]
MGKTSSTSRLNLPGRYAWAAAESIGPFNLTYILCTLPSKLKPSLHSSSSIFGTGLPVQSEILGCLYLLHYLNRAVVSPLFLAPSMSPIHPIVSALMSIFQFVNSSNIACWLTYTVASADFRQQPLISFGSVVGIALFLGGLVGNIKAETKLFELRKGAAKRKARSEGKAEVTYDKVYVIPPVEGMFRTILFPHYVLEWLEWIGFWILGGSWGLGYGYSSPALWFVLVEIATMLPRAGSGRQWYEQKFGKRAVAGRAGAIPGLL